MLPSHAAATPQSCPMAPATHLHQCWSSCWVIPRCSPLDRGSEPPLSPARPPLLLPRQPGPASLSPRGQRPTSALAPLRLPLGRSTRPAAADRPTVLPAPGGARGGGGDALRPRTHFIPSHLYWISRISGLRELVYPIRLHSKGLSARGHGMLCGDRHGDQAGGGGSEGHHLLPAS